MKTKRQPIVVVLGHVDHGKTSLLDALRQTSVFESEAGGITQSIGASVVQTKDGNKITFIDTPGHAAFSAMRSRGSKLADIALLIIDGSDGVKPQTKEALVHIKEVNLPFIVVVTKLDLPSASIDVCLGELEKEGILFEGRGGQTPFIGVSAKKKEKLNELLDLINLFSEVNDIQGDSEVELEAVVIETSMDRGGNMASVVVRNGTLRVGDEIYAENSKCRVKALFDDKNISIKEVKPGEPCKILGFSLIPEIGTVLSNKVDEKMIEEKKVLNKIDKNKIPLYLKAKNAGSLEALVASIPLEFGIVESSVGDVTESDVLNAKANGARIFVFESKIPTSVKKLAEMDKVKIEKFEIIYELLERLNEIVKSGQLEFIGRAEIVAIFPFNDKKIAGCKVLSGKLEKTSDIRLFRNEVELGKVKVVSIKKQKQEVPGVSQGEECGILFTPQLDFQTGDMIVSVK